MIEKQYDDFFINIDQFNFFVQTTHDFKIQIDSQLLLIDSHSIQVIEFNINKNIDDEMLKKSIKMHQSIKFLFVVSILKNHRCQFKLE